jgi:hypothetical protein
VAPNLRSAVDFSHAGDEIDLDSRTYQITGAEGGELLVTHNLLIKNNANGISTIDGLNETRVFEIASGEEAPVVVTMSSLAITHGNGSGPSTGRGGGVLVDRNAQLTMNSCRVVNNNVNADPAQGGGIASQGDLTLNQCLVSQNMALGSGGGNSNGGGLYQDGGTLNINTSTFSQNTAQGGDSAGNACGGGLFMSSSTNSASIVASTFAGNTAQGGPILTGGAGNDGVSGGNGQGGGLYEEVDSGPLSIARSTFSGNQAVGGGDNGNGQGGGLYQDEDAGNISMVNSTFAGNMAVGGGAALPRMGPNVIRPQQATASGNGNGGGLYLTQSNTVVTLINDTIARNSAVAPANGNAQGGGMATGGQGRNSPRVMNTLIALNSAATGPDVFDFFVSLGHNLIGSTAGLTGFVAGPGDLLNVSASLIGLGQLANNGGPTQTLALSANSIAVDHGSDSVLAQLTTCQRGLPRKSGLHVDIGAYEFQVPLPPPPSRGRRNGPLH